MIKIQTTDAILKRASKVLRTHVQKAENMGMHNFLILIKNRRVPPMYVLSENLYKNKIEHFPMKLSIFASEKNIRVLHGQVFVTDPPHGQTNNLHRRKPRRRSASQ